jgi:hypothetical protein
MTVKIKVEQFGDQNKYRVRYKGWFFWHTLSDAVGSYDGVTYFDRHFTSEKEAIAGAKTFEREYAKSRDKWHTVWF